MLMVICDDDNNGYLTFSVITKAGKGDGERAGGGGGADGLS